jgi:hypothetical protein
LITSKLKVFGSYDGLRVIRGSTILSIVPTSEMKRGDFSAIPGNIIDPLTNEKFPDNKIPELRIHNVAQNLLPLFPNPNQNDPVRNYVNSQPSENNNNSISTRIDYELSPRTKTFGRFNINDGKRRAVSSLPAFGTTTTERSQEISIDLTHSFSANKF